MKRIGITGGIGSGKSTFGRFLEEKGAVLFDADRAATQVMEQHPEVVQALKEVLGAEAYLDNGTLNRPFISDVIFSDESKREAVGKIVHPVVQQRFMEESLAAEKMGAPMFVREAAITGATTKQAAMDYSVVIVAPETNRIERVKTRSGLSAEEVKARMEAQPTFADYVEQTNEVIFNEGTMEELRAKANAFFNRMVEA